MSQADTDAPTDNVRPFPGATPESQPHPKADPTSALRSKRYRRGRKRGPERDGRASKRDGKRAPDGQAPQGEKQNEIKSSVTVHVVPPLAPDTGARAPAQRHSRGIRFSALTAALALATVSGGFSITGMTSIFVGAYWPVIGMGVALEVGKMSAVAWLGHQRGTASWRLRTALAVLVAVLMGLNAIGCYGFLAKAHIEHQVEGDVAVAGRAADTKARLAVQAEKVADLTKQIADLDAAGPSRRTPPAIYGPLRPSTPRRQHLRQPLSSAPRMTSAGRPSAPALPTSLRLRLRSLPT
jgi:hypothetical protein